MTNILLKGKDRMFKRMFKKADPLSLSSMISRKTRELERAQTQMQLFSSKMMSAANINEQELKKMAKLHVVLTTPHYSIGARGLPWNGWDPLMIAVPRPADPHHAGYSNKPDDDKHIPSDWLFMPEGTATIIVPSEDDRKRILEEI